LKVKNHKSLLDYTMMKLKKLLNCPKLFDFYIAHFES